MSKNFKNNFLGGPPYNNMGVPNTEEKNTHVKNVDIPVLIENGRTILDYINVSLDCSQYKTIDEFFKSVIERFKRYFDFKGDYESAPTGRGYNAGRNYKTTENVSIIFKYHDPFITDDEMPDIASFHRQKVQLCLSGNALQLLRANGKMFDFLDFANWMYSAKFTRLDIACDIFNKSVKPYDYVKLYENGHYFSRSQLTTRGNPLNPTVYIGSYGSNTYIKIYDKKQEGVDKNSSDEIEIFEAVSDWLRVEVTLTGEDNTAQNAIKHLLRNGNEKVLGERASEILHTILSKKARFLEKPVKDYVNPSRDGINHAYWQMLLDYTKYADLTLTTKPQDLSYQNRKNNFMNRGVGGKNFLVEMCRVEPHAFEIFINMVRDEASDSQ